MRPLPKLINVEDMTLSYQVIFMTDLGQYLHKMIMGMVTPTCLLPDEQMETFKFAEKIEQ